ncbi:uncharacterized protein [Henckelia pumila]|uniref:uncharacterized protein n=1 Tax=Henckelia pumila TaxID=405737 RepID=UPI003C6E2E7D
MQPSQHIDKVMLAVSSEEIHKNRLRLKTTIISVRWLALQGCSFRGHNESSKSLNRGNFLEMLDAFGRMNKEVWDVLSSAARNNTYTSPEVQKEVLNIMANRVRQKIRSEIGDASFCILVDEAHDESKREQIALILRFVNNSGILTERFFAIKSVSDTTSLTLKNDVSNILVHYNIQAQNMRGQGYDVATAKDVQDIWDFFSHLDNVVNMVTSSPKLIYMYGATCKVLEHLSEHSPNTSSQAEVLQKKSQVIFTAMRFVYTTKNVLQSLREDGWEEFLQEVTTFCSKHDVYVPDFNSSYRHNSEMQRKR